MIVSPDYIIKTLTCEEHENALCEGNVLLRSHEFYFNCPGENQDNRKSPRHDPSEFRMPYSADGKRYSGGCRSQDTLLFCASGPLNNCQSDFGNFFVKIVNPCELLYEISENLKPVLMKKSSHAFGKVRYSCYSSYEPFQKTEYYCPQVYADDRPLQHPTTIDSMFNKDKHFASQNEVRMIFILNVSKLEDLFPREGLDIKFFKRDTSDSPDLGASLQTFSNYREWIAAKADNGRDFDNYWFEVRLKVSNRYFSRL